MNDFVPVFLVTGFLDSGKTTFIRDILEDPQFNPKGKNLVIACEEGEEEYSEEFLKKTKTSLVTIESAEEFTSEFLNNCNAKYKPKCVIIEYNGMWPLKAISDVKLPRSWMIGQTVSIVEAPTFNLYWSNMRQQMNERFTIADYNVFTRCENGMDLEQFDRAVHKLKPRGEIDFIFSDGHVESAPPFMPFDLNAAVIDIPDDFFYDWYMHSQDNLDLYEGKFVRFKAQVYKSRHLPSGYFVPGRFVMNCCADDIQFKGYLATDDLAKDIENESWILVTAKIKVEYQNVYRCKGIVLYPTAIGPTEKPAQELAT